MDILINELVNKGTISIDKTIDINDKCEKNIKRLDPVKVNGFIKFNVTEEIELNLDVKGTMYIEDSITLDEIPYNFSFKIEDVISENDEYYANFFKNNKNILDISEILWENIVLEVPMSFTKSKDMRLKGKGWELNSNNLIEEDFKGGE